MSRRQLVEHTWYSDCRICHKRITACTKVVLAQRAEEHFIACRDKAVKKLTERKADAAQGDLFEKAKS